MPRNKKKKTLDYIEKLLQTVPEMRPLERAGTVLTCSIFYDEIEPFIKRVSVRDTQKILLQFILCFTSLQGIAARAHAPLSGSQSIPQEILKMNGYLRRPEPSDALADFKEETLQKFNKMKNLLK